VSKKYIVANFLSFSKGRKYQAGTELISLDENDEYVIENKGIKTYDGDKFFRIGDHKFILMKEEYKVKKIKKGDNDESKKSN